MSSSASHDRTRRRGPRRPASSASASPDVGTVTALIRVPAENTAVPLFICEIQPARQRALGRVSVPCANPASKELTGSEPEGLIGQDQDPFLAADTDRSLRDQLHHRLGLGQPVAIPDHSSCSAPAEHAGLKAGDIVTKIDGTPVRDMNDLRNRIAATAPGSKTTFEIFRNGHSQTLSVQIARMKSETPVAASPELTEELGMVLSNITPDAARALGLNNSDGVLVTSIDPTGAAARSGLRPNDVIVSVNGAATANVAGARSAVAPQMAWLNGPTPAPRAKRRHSGPRTLTVSNPELICVSRAADINSLSVPQRGVIGVDNRRLTRDVRRPCDLSRIPRRPGCGCIARVAVVTDVINRRTPPW